MQNTRHTLYGGLVWICSAITLIVYGFLSYANTTLPGVTDLIRYVTHIDSAHIYIAAAISIFIEGVYVLGSFFPGSSLVIILAIISQSSGPQTFFTTIFTIYVSWVLAGIMNIYIAQLYRSKIIKIEANPEHLVKDHIWTTWFPSFRANHEVAQIVEGAPRSKVFISGLKVRLYASIFMGAVAYTVPLFIDIKDTSDKDGLLSLAIVAMISLVIGVKKIISFTKQKPTSVPTTLDDQELLHNI